jgi:hypothetical protein
MDPKPTKDMEVCHEEKRDDSPDLLELASNNDLESFRWHVEKGSVKVDAVGKWYTRENGTRKMALEERTPLMIAAMYGSLDVLKYIVEMYAKVGGDINKACGRDQSTALHCAASGGSVFAPETVRFLLQSGSNPRLTDAQRRRAADVLSAMDRSGDAKRVLEELLEKEKPQLVSSDENLCKGKMSNLRTELEEVSGKAIACNAKIELGAVGMGKKPLDSSIDLSDLLLETCFLPSSFDDVGLIAPTESNEDSDTSVSSSTLSIASSGSYPSSLSSPSSSPTSPKNYMAKVFPKASPDGTEKVKEYLNDPSLPDIKSNIYSTDEFRMYSFKIRPCSRAYSHDWTECPFAHPGENARRRDPRRYHYSCVPCPDFRKGECQHGDACEYAHGVFECWLHPAQYRTRLCKDGKECNRRVCFFAHVVEELRPLYLSTGSAIPSPKSSGFADISPMDSPRAAASAMLMMQPLFSAPLSHNNNLMHGSLATPPMSPSVASLHLSGGATHASSGGNSRLRPTSKADDSSLTDLLISPDINSRWLNELQSFSASGQSLSAQARVNAAMAASRNRSFSGSFRNVERNTVASMNLDKSRSGSSLSRSFRSVEHSILPTNLDDLFAMESISSPHSPMTREPPSAQYAAMKSACRQAHRQGEMQGQTDVQAQRLSAAEGQLKSPHLLLSPKTPKTALYAQMATTYGSVNLDSHGFDDVHTPTRGFTPDSLGLDCSNLPDWAVNGDSYSRMRSSISPGFGGDVEEPDLSWIQKLVKEEPLDSPASHATCSDVQMENRDIDLSYWVEKLRLDEKWPVRISAPKQVIQ